MLTLVSVDGADAVKLTQVVSKAVPMAKFAGSRGRELSYTLPGLLINCLYCSLLFDRIESTSSSS